MIMEEIIQSTQEEIDPLIKLLFKKFFHRKATLVSYLYFVREIKQNKTLNPLNYNSIILLPSKLLKRLSLFKKRNSGIFQGGD